MNYFFVKVLLKTKSLAKSLSEYLHKADIFSAPMIFTLQGFHCIIRFENT